MMCSKRFTIVSAYIDIRFIEEHIQREQTSSEYIFRGQKLIDLPYNKVVFIDSRHISKFSINDYTTLVPIDKEDIETYNIYSGTDISDIHVNSPNPTKDTAVYHVIQTSKTEFVKKAIDMDVYHDDKYAWIDFGIYKLFNDENQFRQHIGYISQNLGKISTDKIKIPGILHPNKNDTINDFSRVNWYFAGGFFICNKHALLRFEDAVKKEFKILLKERELTFEVNLWFRIWRNDSSIFDWYYGNHDSYIFKF